MKLTLLIVGEAYTQKNHNLLGQILSTKLGNLRCQINLTLHMDKGLRNSFNGLARMPLQQGDAGPIQLLWGQ